MRMLASRDADTVRLQCLANSSMAKDIIRCRRLLDEPRLDLLQSLDVLDRLRDVPHLVRIDHQHTPSGPSVLPDQVRSIRVSRLASSGKPLRVVDDRADDLASLQIGLLVRADFHLEVVKAGSDSFFGEPGDFLVAVSEPAGGGDVGGVTDLADVGFAFGFGGGFFFEEGESLFFGDCVGDVTEGGGIDEFLLDIEGLLE